MEGEIQNNTQDNLVTEKDLAEDMFLKKWPNWLRWTLFLPGAILIPAIFFLIQTIFLGFKGIDSESFWLVVTRGMVYGFGFVLVGSVMAPKHQKVVAIILFTTMAIVLGVSNLSYFFVEVSKMGIFESVLMLLSGGLVLNYIFDELK